MHHTLSRNIFDTKTMHKSRAITQMKTYIQLSGPRYCIQSFSIFKIQGPQVCIFSKKLNDMQSNNTPS